jgi:hybrid cluster-associated redox disulfide protein
MSKETHDQLDTAKQEGTKEDSSSQDQSKPPFSKDLFIQDVVTFYPEVVPVFYEYGLFCVGCAISTMETVEEGAKGHGMSDDEFDNMIEDAKEVVEKKKAEQ